MKMIEQTFEWEGHGCPRDFAGWQSFCRLRIYARDGNTTPVIVVSDIPDRVKYPDGTGTSITNSAENLARLIIQTFTINPYDFVFIEHYPETSTSEQFARVEFEYIPKAADGATFQHPRWSHVTRAGGCAHRGQ
jgi:hypothetical protein